MRRREGKDRERSIDGRGQSMGESNPPTEGHQQGETTSQRIYRRQRGWAGGGPKHRIEKRHAELGTADDTSQNLRVWKSNLEIHKHQLSLILGREITRTGGFL